MKSYDEYRKHLENLEYKKKMFLEYQEQLKQLRIKYNTYLLANPYKKEYNELNRKLQSQRKKLIELI